MLTQGNIFQNCVLSKRISSSNEVSFETIT
uniref:Uncharacterized protein n=1 Tax=Siphoviridae sp. ctZHD14 TaxID=2827891 RepID=A0A8S5SWG6_9CAUD|nr:MAG TPA: hypothetical protein [Siphoviridae sp. ctZHD14]